jgi:hypothetical protein
MWNRGKGSDSDFLSKAVLPPPLNQLCYKPIVRDCEKNRVSPKRGFQKIRKTFLGYYIRVCATLVLDLAVSGSINSSNTKSKKPPEGGFLLFNGAGKRIRTLDRLITSQMLYQLSYPSILSTLIKLFSIEKSWKILAENARFTINFATSLVFLKQSNANTCYEFRAYPKSS